MSRRNHLPTIFLTSVALAGLTITPSLGQFVSPDWTKLNRFVQTNNASDASTKVFRVGRDLIEEDKYDAAARQFKEYITAYPTSKNVDAAYYWLAFSLKKQGRMREADATLQKLVVAYPKSSWVRDATAMRIEMAPALGNDDLVAQAIGATMPPPARPVAVGGQVATTIPTPQVAPAAPVADIYTPFPPVEVNIASAGGFTFVTVPGQSSKMDEKDEIKAIALQSLMQSNPERAIPYIADILKNDSKASTGLKESAIRLLSQYRGSNSTPLLLDLVRNQSDPKLRRTAIYSLGNVDDEKVFDLLLDLATKAEDPDVAKAALSALSRHRSQRAKDMVGNLALSAKSPLIRRDALYLLGDRNDDTSIDRIIQVYDSESDPDIKKYAIYALSRSSNAKARQKLLEIARNNSNEDLRVQAIQWLDNRGDASLVDELVKLYQADKSPKVRKQVIFSLSQMASRGSRYLVTPRAVGGQNALGATAPAIAWAGDLAGRSEKTTAERAEKAAKALLGLYDGESDEAMKSQMLYAFSQSKSKEALQKLMQVAKSDSSVALRKKAVVYLGQSNDPDASKFLEDILK
ncbi:MAG: HEAT repeat domain-containing protein [Acidobacteria bacterium]|nr:HEAT repeat domain-containing protein [Acidobacteriota bacterium]